MTSLPLPSCSDGVKIALQFRGRGEGIGCALGLEWLCAADPALRAWPKQSLPALTLRLVTDRRKSS